jgi:hypothetical protein
MGDGTLACDRENIAMQRDSSKLQVSDDHTDRATTALTLKKPAYTVSLPYIPGKVYLFDSAHYFAAILNIMKYP